MNDMNNRKNIVERIQKKIKHSNLKPDEIQAIDKARRQVYNQSESLLITARVEIYDELIKKIL